MGGCIPFHLVTARAATQPRPDRRRALAWHLAGVPGLLRSGGVVRAVQRVRAGLPIHWRALTGGC
eukprot:scaffold262_cov230-Pinguiococcus_pyrenoidosus.AAC.10